MFYAELRGFLPAAHRDGPLVRSFHIRGNIKDSIEICGVPHTESELSA